MMTSTIKIPASIILTAFLLSACSMFGKDDDVPEYYEVSESPALTIPENLDKPNSDSALTIDHQPIPLPSEPMNTVPPRVVVNQSDEDDNSMLRWASEGVYILVEEPTSGVKERLGVVIQDSGMQLLGKADDGDYRFVFKDTRPETDKSFWDKVTFWNDDLPDYSGSYLTLSQPEGDKTRIYLKYADGGEVPIEAAEYVLAILKAHLG